MLSKVEDRPQTQSHAHPVALKRPRMVVGITSDQTCLVLTGRLRALRHAGFDITLVSSPGEELKRMAESERITAHPLPMRRGISPIADLRSLVALLRFLMRERPLITDFSTPKAGLLGNFAGWMLRVPHRVYTLRGLKLESSRGWRQRLLLYAERVSARCSHVVLCNSASLRLEAIRLRIAPAAKLQILGNGSSNGVNTRRFSPGKSTVRKNLNIPEDDLVLGFVGRLTNDKGIPELLTAFEEIIRVGPRVWLLLVGWFDASEDALAGHWRTRIADHPCIRHTGYVADPENYYRAMDMLILPTHREGFPNAILEASACGLPVITTETTGARDAVVPEVTGLLIPPHAPQAIAKAAMELIVDPERRKRMGLAGRAWVGERFSQEHVLGLAADFYRDLLANRQ